MGNYCSFFHYFLDKILFFQYFCLFLQARIRVLSSVVARFKGPQHRGNPAMENRNESVRRMTCPNPERGKFKQWMVCNNVHVFGVLNAFLIERAIIH